MHSICAFVTRGVNHEFFFAMITDDSKIEVTLTTTVLSPELNSTSVVPEETLTTTGLSSELSTKHSYEISSSTPFLKSFTSFDKAMESNNGIIVIYVCKIDSLMFTYNNCGYYT